MEERIKHIRSIHFLMLATSFAIFAAINFDAGKIVQKSLSDLQTINSSVQNWNPGFLVDASRSQHPINAGVSAINNSFEDIISTAISKYVDQYGYTLYPLHDDIKKHNFQIKEGFPQNINIITNPTLFNWGVVPIYEYEIEKPETLAEFSHLWDALDRYLSVTLITIDIKGYSFYKVTNDVPEVMIDNVGYVEVRLEDKDQARLTIKEVELFYDMQRHAGREFALIAKASYDNDLYQVIVDPALKKFYVHGQEAFNMFHGGSLRKGKFSQAYFELDNTTKKYQDLKIGKLIDITSSELSRSEDKIELLGIKIPSSEIVKWGLPVIVIIQLYFLIHLHELMRLHKSRIEQPWILLYPDLYAHIASILTLVFPLFVVLWLEFTILSDVSKFGLLMKLLGVLSVFIAVMVIRRAVKIREINA